MQRREQSSEALTCPGTDSPLILSFLLSAIIGREHVGFWSFFVFCSFVVMIGIMVLGDRC